MTRTIKLAMAAAMALGATSAFATNGDTLMGLGAKTRGMGGVGIGVSHGAESALANPAMITTVKNTEISFGGTIFMPNVASDLGMGSVKSDADMNMIPEVSLANKVNDNFYWGIGMWGTAGMGVDYREASGMTSNFNMVTNLQLMQFGVPLAYTNSGFSIGVTPIMQYGALDINYAGTLDTSTAYTYGMAPAPSADVAGGAGVAQDFGYGFTVGASYDFANVGVEGLTLGAVYKSAIEMEYKGQLSGATSDFAGFGFNGGTPLDDKLEQPAEYGVGLSYEMMGNTIAFDYKKINWSSAKGYEDFGWKDQNVYAIGYEYATQSWAVRAGFNYAESPIEEQDGATLDGALFNMFNLLGFPATVEQHYSLGGTYNFSETLSVDGAFVYAAEVKDTYSLAVMSNFGPMNPQSIETKHSQTGVSVQVNYDF